MDTKTKLTKARTRLLLSQPFFGSLALRMDLVERVGIETMATDGAAVYYNPEFVDRLSMDELVGVFAHEVMHPACNHHTRRGARDASRWNMAADYAINPLLVDNGFTLPESALLDPAYAGMSAEAIYHRMPPAESGGGGQGGNGQGDGDCPDPGGCGGVMDAPGAADRPTLAECAASEAEWRQAVAQAATVAKNAGKLPGDLERVVDEILHPKAEWRDILRRFVMMNAKADYRWAPPNRRFIHQGIYLPACRSESFPPIAVAIDTSGSVSQTEMNQFAAEITAILEDCMPEEIHVLYCDSRLRNAETFTPFDLPITLNARGGGGTDFRPPFDWLDEADVHPACMVYLTDLCCSSYPDEPAFPTLWVTSSPAELVGAFGQPPFGEVVHMEGAHP